MHCEIIIDTSKSFSDRMRCEIYCAVEKEVFYFCSAIDIKEAITFKCAFRMCVNNSHMHALKWNSNSTE